jgi:hypothetical protein
MKPLHFAGHCEGEDKTAFDSYMDILDTDLNREKNPVQDAI